MHYAKMGSVFSMFLRKMKGGCYMESFVEQLWTMVMNEQVTPQYDSLFAMKQALQRKYPDDASMIAQAHDKFFDQLSILAYNS